MSKPASEEDEEEPSEEELDDCEHFHHDEVRGKIEARAWYEAHVLNAHA